jgi:hypothetical protein
MKDSLNHIRIAAPCPVSWDRMTGDERVRFCDECHLRVYNIAAMSRAEAQTLIAKTEARLCVRIYRRADGTVITRDCPVGLRAIRRRMARSATAVFAALIALGTSAFGQKPGSKDKSSCRQQVVMTRELIQTQNGSSSVTGTIIDPNGAVIARAAITITGETTTKSLTTTTDEEGKFTMAALEPGNFKIAVKSPGFKVLQLNEVKLMNNEKLNIEVTMLLDASSITMGIIALEPSLIDSPPGTFIINEKMIQRLPHED